MDVAGSFLELSCVRIALIPAGNAMPDYRFEELTSYLSAFREIPVSALPRRAAVPRTSGNATFSAMPAAFRDAISEASSSTTDLHRSRSATKDIGRALHNVTKPMLRNSISKPTMRKAGDGGQNTSALDLSIGGLGVRSFSHRRRQSEPVASRANVDLDMKGSDVDASFRLRYDIVHRDHAGTLLMKPFSEWDDFHSSKIWGVIGIVDCTQPGVSDNVENRKQAIFDAYDDFSAALTNFKDASVRRLIVFTSQDAAQQSGHFVLNDPISASNDIDALRFSVGYVPERAKAEATRLEVRAQIIHFSGLVLNAIDRDCWKRRESPPSDLFRSPIDEKYTADRQSKLAKRRAGRLDKILGDSLLLMGNPSEALAKYNSAIEKAKANSDRLWLAGAMEGWSAAHVLTHVGSGGSVNAPALSDRLIEHYTEIYKLYQKKRVAEPEAAAALRLAGFLGRWTNRRKDALEAAEHAATVGEGLKVQKKAALWEALARFSDQMGCRRKAALYLYRLGHLNASQSIWSSAVTLMVASERQLTKDGRKSWSDLNRKVLLMAAGHAESAGDSSTAARLLVEALVTPPHSSRTRHDEDENLIKSLNRFAVPTFLPAASNVVQLGGISALQISGLCIRRRIDSEGYQKTDTGARDGPFIYNPFEAKKRAKAAAVARRAVTWICGEHAQVSVRFCNKTSAELVLEVIAVLMSTTDISETEGKDSFSKFVPENGLEKNGATLNDDDASMEHSRNVRQALKRSSKIAKTISESVSLPSQELRSGVVKHITVMPKRTGPLYVTGLLVRLFNGALVVMETEASDENEIPPVNVIFTLPRISIQTHSTEGGTIESVSGRTPLTVYHGERRRFHVEIENTGTEPIGWMKVRVLSSRPEVLKIVGHDFNDTTILQALEHRGSSKTFTVEVLGTHQSGIGAASEVGWIEASRSNSSLSTVSIVVEYEGAGSLGVIRESSTHVKVSSRSALRIMRIDFFSGPLAVLGKSEAEGQSEYFVSIEVQNDVSAPATVKLVTIEDEQLREPTSPSSKTTEDRTVSNEDHFHLVENGASARLICNVPVEKISELHSRLETGFEGEAEQNVYRIQWKLPALGRGGILDVSREVLCTTMARTYGRQANQILEKRKAIRSKFRRIEAEISWSIGNSSAPSTAEARNKSRSIPKIQVGRFCVAEVTVKNKGKQPLLEQAMLDIDITQIDAHGPTEKIGVVIVGVTEGIAIGSLPALTGVFRHKVRMRISSVGTFQLQAFLYNRDESPLYSEDGDIIYQKRPPALGQLEDTAVLRYVYSASKALTDEMHISAIPAKSVRASTTNADIETESSTSLDLAFQGSVESPVTPASSRALQRVGIVKKKKVGDKVQLSPNIVHPRTVDSYPEGGFRPKLPPVLVCSILPFAAMKDQGNSRIHKDVYS